MRSDNKAGCANTVHDHKTTRPPLVSVPASPLTHRYGATLKGHFAVCQLSRQYMSLVPVLVVYFICITLKFFHQLLIASVLSLKSVTGGLAVICTRIYIRVPRNQIQRWLHLKLNLYLSRGAIQALLIELAMLLSVKGLFWCPQNHLLGLNRMPAPLLETDENNFVCWALKDDMSAVLLLLPWKCISSWS